MLNQMKKVYLLLGSNLGNREKHLAFAQRRAESLTGTLTAVSSVYETEPWGNHQQPWFLNRIIVIETPLTAQEVLHQCLLIEKEAGRIRTDQFGARTLDIDILYFDNDTVNEVGLIIPHPEISGRRFVLTPLAEIIPHFVHPVLKATQNELLKNCTDPLEVRLFGVNF